MHPYCTLFLKRDRTREWMAHCCSFVKNDLLLGKKREKALIHEKNCKKSRDTASLLRWLFQTYLGLLVCQILAIRTGKNKGFFTSFNIISVHLSLWSKNTSLSTFYMWLNAVNVGIALCKSGARKKRHFSTFVYLSNYFK